MAATMKLSLTFIVLLSGALLEFGDVGDAAATCDTVRCIQGGNVTCANHGDKVFQGCVCLCAPKDGRHCVLRLHDGSLRLCPGV